MPIIPVDNIPELVERHEHGESYRTLANELNVSHMTVKRAIESYDPTLATPDILRGLKLYDKVRLRRDVKDRFYPLEKGEVVQIIGFDIPENSAIVTCDRYEFNRSFDVPIDALEKCESVKQGRKSEHIIPPLR